MSVEARKQPKLILGVVSDKKMSKTAKLKIDYVKKHPKYGKFVRRTKFVLFHDEKDLCNVGDKVYVVETRPLSKLKRHRLVKVVETSQTGDLA